MLKVSAIITTHNRIECLKYAIDSVKRQTYKNIECIVVSDNSSDGTNEYCASVDDLKLVIIPESESQGGNYARNLGIKTSTGEFVAFLDDDDIWNSTKIEKQLKLALEKNVDCVYCGLNRNYYKNGHIVTSTPQLPNPIMRGDVSKEILCRIMTTTSCLMVRRTALLNIGCFDENIKFWQEYELTIRLAQITKIFYVNEALCEYMVNADDKNRLTNKVDGWKTSVAYIYHKHKGLYDKQNLIDKYLTKLTYAVDVNERTRSAGMKWQYIWYRFLLNTFYIPARIILKYKILVAK